MFELTLSDIGVFVNSTVTVTVVASPAVKLVFASLELILKYSVLLLVVATDKSVDKSVLTFCTVYVAVTESPADVNPETFIDAFVSFTIVAIAYVLLL